MTPPDALPPAPARLTTEQSRAANALERIRAHDVAGPASYGKYVSYVSALPAQIVMNGLGQALATQLATAGRGARERDPHYLLYADVATWLASQIAPWNGTAPPQLIDQLINSDQKTYLRAQVEALAYLNWLKKFARAILQEKPADTNTEGAES